LDTAWRSTGSGGKKTVPASYRIFNLGNTSPVTVPTLVSILERHLKVKAKKKVVEMPGNGDVPFTHTNISSARREFGYRPTTDLQTGSAFFLPFGPFQWRKLCKQGKEEPACGSACLGF
ncbi:unnamed protein product, partial [Linum tenue]